METIIEKANKYADEKKKVWNFGPAERQMIIEAYIQGYEDRDEHGKCSDDPDLFLDVKL